MDTDRVSSGQDLAGKVAIVTGATSYIGAAIAARAVGAGARVVLGDLDVDRGRRVAAPLGAAARFVPADVTNDGDLDGLIAVDGGYSAMGREALGRAFEKIPVVEPPRP